MKQRAIFLFYHGFGHINAFLKPAWILEENNYDVWFAGSGFFRDYIAAQGCKFYLLKSYPFGAGLEKWINTVEGKNNIYFRTLWDRITDKVFIDRQVDLYWMLEELKPTLVFIDRMQSTDFLVIYPHLKARGIKTAIINTMLPTQITLDRPPLNSDALPADKQSISKAIRNSKWNKLKKAWKQKLTMFGFDDEYIISRGIKKNPIPNHYISRTENLLNFNLERVSEFILAPKEFDFPNSALQNHQTYVGFLTATERVHPTEKDIEDRVTTILKRKRENNLKLIYCSFGTIPPKQQQAIATFFRKLVAIASGGEFLFLISANSQVVIPDNHTQNFYVLERVPQIDILKQADVFITHGGLNSIKEAVCAEVPMLVYPVHNEYDPRGNAARIFFHRLGLRGDIVSHTADDITSNIRKLLSNNDYRENIRQLKNADQHYTGVAFMKSTMAINPLE